MATYSSAPTESIERFSIKNSAFGSTTFETTIVTVAANEQYELLQLHAVAQDGIVSSFHLHGDYASLVDEPGDSSRGISGYSWYADFGGPFTEEGTVDSEQTQTAVDMTALDYTINSNTSVADQYTMFVNNFGPKRLIFREGAIIKLEHNLSAFTPSDEEFIDVDLWFKKIVYNG